VFPSSPGGNTESSLFLLLFLSSSCLATSGVIFSFLQVVPEPDWAVEMLEESSGSAEVSSRTGVGEAGRVKSSDTSFSFGFSASEGRGIGLPAETHPLSPLR